MFKYDKTKSYGLYKFYWDLRDGHVAGLFIATKEEVENLIDKDVWFGEINGNNSEVAGTVELDDIKLITEDQDYIENTYKLFGTDQISGYNPLCYLEEE